MGGVCSSDQEGSDSVEVLAGHLAAKRKEMLRPWLEAALRHPPVGHNVLLDCLVNTTQRSLQSLPGLSCTRTALLETFKEKESSTQQ